MSFEECESAANHLMPQWLRRGCVLLVLSAALAGCVSYDTVPVLPNVQVDPALYHPAIESTYYIEIGDTLDISSYYDNHLAQEVTVRPDGRVTLLLIGEQDVAGKTIKEVSEQFKKAYAHILHSPDITVTLKDSPSETVFIGGEVNKPGLEPMKGSLTLLQGVTLAGGFLSSAREDEVLLLRRQTQGQFRVFKFNARDVLTNKNADIYLQRYDIVYVPRTNITNMDIFVDQYLTKTLPQWLRFNFDYEWVNGATAVVTH